MARTLSTIVTLTPEQKLAKLILIPYLLGSDRVLTNQPQETKGFGSSNKPYWIQQIRDSHPELELKINGKTSGADVSVLSLFHWPEAWSMQPAITQLCGWAEPVSLSKFFTSSVGQSRGKY
jgi:hypothetical protein